MKKSFYLFSLIIPIIALSACSQAPTEKTDVGMYCEQDNGLFNFTPEQKTASLDDAGEPEGPQYQQPTMEVLRGKSQLYPAKYPIKRYPHSTVAMVDVRPNRAPGLKNMVMLKTTDEMPNVSSYYEQRLIAENWKMVSQFKNTCYESTKWVKGDKECEIRVCPDMTTQDKKFIQLFIGTRLNRHNDAVAEFGESS